MRLLTKVEYFNAEDRKTLISKHKDKFLIEEHNIKEGNFLIFTDVKPVDLELQELKSQLQVTQEAIDFLIMGGL